jgi:hypothetical protein
MSERRAKRPDPEAGADVSEEADITATEEAPLIDAESVPYEALVIDPPEEADEPDPQVEEEVVPDGAVRIVYRAATPGGVLTHGDYKFRSDEPVIVPSEVAEELLTLPFENFERL